MVDELGMLSEKSRGPQLEIMLAGVLLSPYQPTLLGLTTPLGRIEDIHQLIGGFLLEIEKRPLDIRAGVWTRQQAEFHSWSCNSGEPYPPEKWDLNYPLNKDKMLKELILRYKKGIMVALPSRNLTLNYASRLAKLVEQDSEIKKMLVGQSQACLSIEDRLKGLEATQSKELLTGFLKRGIGIHNADLSPEERKEVEDAFRNREIAVVFCTNTLSRGINLPAETIIFMDWGSPINPKDPTCSYCGKLLDEFTNWMGRIGRPGKSSESQASAIYLAQTKAEAQQIKKLIFAKRATLTSHLNDPDTDLNGHLLNAAASLANTAIIRARSAHMDASTVVFDTRAVQEFFSQTLGASDPESKKKLLERAVNILLALTNPETGTALAELRELVSQLMDSSDSIKAKLPSVRLSGRQVYRLIQCLHIFSGFGGNSQGGESKVIVELKNELKASLREYFHRCTLAELTYLVPEADLYPQLCQKINALRRMDKLYPLRRVGELRLLLEQDSRFDSIPDFKKALEKLIFCLNIQIDSELENLFAGSRVSWLSRVRACQLSRQRISELARTLESEETLGTLLHSRDHSATPIKIGLRYLTWVEIERIKGFQLTPVGRVCASHGIAIATCDHLYNWLNTEVVNEKVREIEVERFFLLLLSTFDGARIRLLKTQLPREKLSFPGSRSYFRKSIKLVADKDAVVTCSAMKDWINGLPTIEIERKYSLGGGSLHEVARQISRLIRAFHDITTSASISSESEILIPTDPKKSVDRVQIPNDLDALAERVQYGLPLEALPVVSLRVEGLTRSWIMDLLKGLNGLNIDKELPIIERIRLLNDEQLKGLLPTQGLFKRLKAALEKYHQIPLANKLVRDRQFMLRYYLLPQVIKAQLERGKSYLSEQGRYTALRMVTRDGGHIVLRRNDLHTGKPIIIRNVTEYMDWLKRGAIDFYGEIGETVPLPKEVEHATDSDKPRRYQYLVDRFFVDLDPRNGFPLNKLKAVTCKIYEFVKQSPQIEGARIYWTEEKASIFLDSLSREFGLRFRPPKLD